MAKQTFFDVINDISSTKKHLLRSDEPVDDDLYNPFMINRGLSYNVDCILFANEMNAAAHIDHVQQYDYLLHSIRPKKRFTKWVKKVKEDEIQLLQDFFKINRKRAVEYRKILTDEQIEEVQKKMNTGGRSK